MEVDSSRHVADRRLLARDMALLEALDEHTNVRHAMLAAASLDPRTAQAAQKAYAAAERREQFSAESGSLAGEGTLRAAQEMIMYHKAVGVERAEYTAAEIEAAGIAFSQAEAEDSGRQLNGPMVDRVASSQPCLVGADRLALPPMRLKADEPQLSTVSVERRDPQKAVLRAKQVLQQQGAQRAADAVESGEEATKAPRRPVTTAAARKLHARAALYLPMR